MKSISPKLYFFTLLLTACVFFAALYISNYLTQRKTEELKAVEDKVAIEILSLETQLDVINQTACSTLDTTTLRIELDDLSSKLTYMEQQVGENNPDVFRLKRYYSLLEIRDYLLTQKADKECNHNDVLILYFYSQKQCDNCLAQQYILQAVQQEYPNVRVYSFDFNQDLSAVETLITLHNIPKNPPIIDINGKVYAAFNSLEDMNAVLSPLENASSTSATSTSSKASVKAPSNTSIKK